MMIESVGLCNIFIVSLDWLNEVGFVTDVRNFNLSETKKEKNFV